MLDESFRIVRIDEGRASQLGEDVSGGKFYAVLARCESAEQAGRFLLATRLGLHRLHEIEDEAGAKVTEITAQGVER